MNQNLEACEGKARLEESYEPREGSGSQDGREKTGTFSVSDEASFAVRQDEKKDSDILFFPGCQLGASNPAYVQKAYEAVCAGSENASLYAGCCGVPALWAGQTKEAAEVTEKVKAVWESLGKPMVVTACPTCLKNLRKTIPEMQVESLYVWMNRGNATNAQPANLPTVRVLDPCASVEEKESQQAVRDLLTKAGYTVENASADIGCCGFGGHIVAAVPDLQKKFAERRVSDKDGILVSYCANCRDVFANEGADARHLLGLLFGIDDERRLPPDLDERRENRRELKRMYLGDNADENATDSNAADENPANNTAGAMDSATTPSIPANSATTPSIPANSEILIQRPVLDKMNRELILREQVLQTLLEAEADKSMILDEEDGLFYAHKRFNTITIWVVYCKNGESIQVTNVYVHRVDIREND